MNSAQRLDLTCSIQLDENFTLGRNGVLATKYHVQLYCCPSNLITRALMIFQQTEEGTALLQVKHWLVHL